MAVIGTMAVNIVATTDKFISGLNSAQTALGRFVKKASTVGNLLAMGAGLEGLRRMLTGFEAAGSELHDMSIATGVTVDNLAMLQYAAGQSGASIENLQMAFKTMAKQGIDPNRFAEMADRIARLPTPAARARKALELFGKQGMKLLPMIDELPEMSAEFTRLGGGMTSRLAGQADNLGDAWDRVKFVLSNVRNQVANALTPALVQFSDWLSPHLATMAKWIDQHRTLTTWVAMLGAGLITIVPTIIAVAKAIDIMTHALKMLNIQKAIAYALANPKVALGVLAVAGLAYGGYKLAQQYNPAPNAGPSGQYGSSRSWDSQTPRNTKMQVDEQRRTNQLLQQMSGGSGLVAAGVTG